MIFSNASSTSPLVGLLERILTKHDAGTAIWFPRRRRDYGVLERTTGLSFDDNQHYHTAEQEGLLQRHDSMRCA